MYNINIGLFGFGTVGLGVLKNITEHYEIYKTQFQIDIVVKKIVVNNLNKKRSISFDQSIITDDPNSIFEDDSINLIIELTGNKEITQKIINHCAKFQIPLVTANKAFLAESLKIIKNTYASSQSLIGYEAAVAGSIPIINTLKHNFNSNKISKIIGIINGTANYILSSMSQNNLEFNTALKEAQKLGYAEADPTFDIKGHDTAHKLIILMCLAFKKNFDFESVYLEGITEIDAKDIFYTSKFGYTIKLLGIAEKIDGKYRARVHPTLIPNSHIFSNIDNAYNAILVKANFAGDSIFYGHGAGEKPTASAVMDDVISLSLKLKLNEQQRKEEFFDYDERPLENMDMLKCGYYILLCLKDRIGVLEEIGKIFKENDVSVCQLEQLTLSENKDDDIDMAFFVHPTYEKNIEQVVKKIEKLSYISHKPKFIRIF